MLALALILDAVFGEPDWLWRRVAHPAVLFGRLVDRLEHHLNEGRNRRVKGALAVLALVLASWLPAALMSAELFGGLLELLGAAVLLAQRSLVEHVRAVAEALRASLAQGRRAVAQVVGRDPETLDAAGVARAAVESAAENFADAVALRGALADGRRAVAQVVGRDPETLDAAGVARAAVESAAENFADAVVAPAFWFLVAGLPGMAVYKAVNTADSMIGHQSPRHAEFGWAAARLDDLLSWIPARLAGAAICLVGGGRRAFEVMRRDAGLHRSPNAGWPEAATAASLGLALAGPRIYAGVVTDDPWLNPEGRRAAHPRDIEDALALVWRAWGVVLAAAVVAAFLGR